MRDIRDRAIYELSPASRWAIVDGQPGQVNRSYAAWHRWDDMHYPTADSGHRPSHTERVQAVGWSITGHVYDLLVQPNATLMVDTEGIVFVGRQQPRRRS